jgi:hypothetical protein
VKYASVHGATTLIEELDVKLEGFFGWSVALCLSACALQAQETNQLEQLQRQLRRLQEDFEKTVSQQRQQIDVLQKQIEALQPAKTGPSPATGAPATSPATNAPLATPPSSLETKPWSPTDPIRLLGNRRNYLDLSLDGLMAAGGASGAPIRTLELGGEDPSANGFTLQSLEAVFAGAVDPFFRAQASLTFSIDTAGESQFELEEAWAQTTSLPWNLQVKAGQYLTEFGRLNPTHPHTWWFVDTPLPNGRLLGPDGIANPGLLVSWLMPTKFYSELSCGIQNSTGEGAYNYLFDHDGERYLGRPAVRTDVDSFTDLLFTPRYAVSFDLTDSQTLLLGASGAFGPNSSGQSSYTETYGLDVFWKWKPTTHHGGFPFVAWQSEALFRRYEAGAYNDGAGYIVPDEMLKDYGFYSQIEWGFRKGWVAGLRGDYVAPTAPGQYEVLYGPDPKREDRWRISPSVTWYPSEFSKIRLQYNHDRGEAFGVANGVWVQFEFILGAHAAHKF